MTETQLPFVEAGSFFIFRCFQMSLKGGPMKKILKTFLRGLIFCLSRDLPLEEVILLQHERKSKHYELWIVKAKEWWFAFAHPAPVHSITFPLIGLWGKIPIRQIRTFAHTAAVVWATIFWFSESQMCRSIGQGLFAHWKERLKMNNIGREKRSFSASSPVCFRKEVEICRTWFREKTPLRF